MIYSIINWIISGLAVLTIIINVIYTFVYLSKVNYSYTFNFTEFFTCNFLCIFGCTVDLFLSESINMLLLFVAILCKAILCICLYGYSYDKVYSPCKKQLRRNKLIKSIKTIKTIKL